MIIDALQKYFGFNQLREGQENVMQSVLDGRSAAAIFPTGSGKSLCYQLPAQLLPNLTLVISPLLALMKDQIDFMQSKGIKAAKIDSSQGLAEQKAIYEGIKSGETKVLLISVERLKNDRFRSFLKTIPISLLVVDEAHCISEWGHNFRPDYLKIPDYKEEFNIPQVLLLTATATKDVVKDMQSKFAIAKDDVVVTGFYRPNLNLQVLPIKESDKEDALIELLKDEPNEATIIYVTLQKTAELVAQTLQKRGVEAEAFHASLKPEVKQSIQNRFIQNKLNCIVATIAFGMGIDKSNIRKVIHYDLPKSMENYSQEIGRAGRDQQNSNCYVLANETGLQVLENFVYGDTPSLTSIEWVLNAIKNAGEHWEKQDYHLSKDSNIRQLPLKTLLVYLEMQQLIKPLFSYYSSYRFKEIKSTTAIVQAMPAEKRAFIEAIFKGSQKSKVWWTVDMDKVYENTGAERKRIAAALDYFDQKGWISLEVKGLTDRYQILNTSFDASTLASEIHELFKTKETAEIRRIHNMLKLFKEEKCLNIRLANYFGHPIEKAQCGHCSVCESKYAPFPPAEAMPDLDVSEWGKKIDLLQAKSKKPLDSSTKAYWLCGISTPLLASLRVKQVEGHAQLEKYPFDKVLEMVEKI